MHISFRNPDSLHLSFNSISYTLVPMFCCRESEDHPWRNSTDGPRCKGLRRGVLVGRTWRAWGCRIDGKNSPGKTLAVQPIYGGLQIRHVLQFHKAESTGVASDAIAYHLCKRYGMALLLEPLS